MNKKKFVVNIIINILIVALFAIAAYVALYITANKASPWIWIAAYWITLAIKNGMDVVQKGIGQNEGNQA